jgi:hypothetical protein
MQPYFAGHELLFRLHMFGVRYATVNRANRCTLRFLVKAGAFGAFARNDVIVFF